MKNNINYISFKLPALFFKNIPLWLVILLIINSSMITGFTQYYILNKKLNDKLLELSLTTNSAQELVQILKQQVIPQKGYVLGAKWHDTGMKLIASGIIDENKFRELFADEPEMKQQMKIFSETINDRMVINERNARFMVNTLWALGLVNKSKILDEGSMKKYGDGNHLNYASTGGWTLGTIPTEDLYSSTQIITLNSKQEEIVKKIAESVFRPCCNNHAEFPDCNHGMAVLGYIQLALKQGLAEDRIYQDLLRLNSYWFPQNYLEIAAYFKKQGKSWDKLNAQNILSAQYSSAQGSAQIKQSIQGLPAINSGGGCAV